MAVGSVQPYTDHSIIRSYSSALQRACVFSISISVTFAGRRDLDRTTSLPDRGRFQFSHSSRTN